MKIAMINVVCGGSTGRLMELMRRSALAEGHEVRVFYGRGSAPGTRSEGYVKCGGRLHVYRHVLRVRLLDQNGHGSRSATKQLVRELTAFAPDVIHLHNIHGYYLHLATLFDYLTNHTQAKVIWTLHDCWAFTGRCAYFTEAGCTRWIDGCHDCPAKNVYPKSFRDRSARGYGEKKQWFSGLIATGRLTLAAPSHWLAQLVRKSFLQSCPVITIPNGIDLAVFRPCGRTGAVSGAQRFADVMIPEHVRVILGVSFVWDDRKRFPIYCEIARRFNPQQAVVVLVGLTDREFRMLPEGAIGIRRTENAAELAAFYSRADVFISASVEDTFPTVMLEALACGTPVVCTDRCGCPEIIDEKTGIVVPADDIDAFLSAIQRILETGVGPRRRQIEPADQAASRRTHSSGGEGEDGGAGSGAAAAFRPEDCRRRAEENFDQTQMTARYMALYES